MSRRAYGLLMTLPAFGLFDGERLVATIRAHGIDEARVLLHAHNDRQPKWQLRGDRVRKL